VTHLVGVHADVPQRPDGGAGRGRNAEFPRNGAIMELYMYM
jgi:hypothetical protein